MTDHNLSNQQLRQLELLGKGHPVIATWSHQALGDMWRLGLVNKQNAFNIEGRTSGSCIWTIAPAGLRLLERAGR